MKNNLTTNLFSKQPSILKGISRLIAWNESAEEYSYSDDPDTEAIANDWQNVGQELFNAIKSYDQYQAKRAS